ncbi:guanylate kinase-associated protein mars [Scaptodrosophila lebanonensis]|uniref:Guanylate kinase-associated protein mars n=1 Tax=Drosophila lebanonensis TaxID=7225 RepID=A0A6J2TG06_DROLE|nr:guanylate kinase-associated protein mars [Scaptodrosophila lebanonensis]
MERYKPLYKETATMSPSNRSMFNRERQRAVRTKQRNDCFHSNRIISVSPTPRKQKPAVAINQTEKDTVAIDQTEKDAAASSALANKENQPSETETTKDASANTKTKLRQDKFIQRYLAWKAAKKRNKAPNASSDKAPLLPTSKQNILAHKSDIFKPPANLKNPVAEASKRRSLYVVIEPKPKEKTGLSQKKTLPANTLNSHAKPTCTAVSKPKPSSAALSSKAKPLSAAPAPKAKPLSAAPAPKAKLPPAAVKSVPIEAKASTGKQQRPPKEPGTTSSVGPSKLKTSSKPATAKPIVTAKPPPPNLVTQPFKSNTVASYPNIVKPIRGREGGAAAKFKTSTNNAKETGSINGQPKTKKLSVRMKSKKGSVVTKKKTQLMLPQIRNEQMPENTLSAPPDTPFESDNPFQDRATSTQIKSNSGFQNLFASFKEIEGISPVARIERARSIESSAKRQLLPSQEQQQLQNTKRKFNFTRYSGAPIVESPAAVDEPTLQAGSPPKDSKTAAEEKTLLPQTPPRTSLCEPNYLSPFVSVSRGKVNSRSEREKRNSMYLPDQETPSDQSEVPVAVRRALETVGYFRIQLDNETKRLHALCDEWETYKSDHEVQLAESGGMDMINAAIGQTKLLTSKKLMQFRSLIDRCEAGATGVGARPDDGSEDTKPVQPEDLEGWWDMVRLQSDNVDKRFQNLQLWKANGWTDPDAIPTPVVKPKAKVKLAKQSKAKSSTKPSSNIKQFLLKAYAERRKQHTNGTKEHLTAGVNDKEADNTVSSDTLSNRRSQRLSEGDRLIIVRDRRSFSPSPTVLKMSNGRRASMATGGKALLKTTLKASMEQTKHSVVSTPPSTPAPVPILKTPGTAKRERGLRSVIFSAKKKVRKFQFTFDEANDNSSGEDALTGGDQLEDFEEEMSLEGANHRNSTDQAQQSQEGNGIDVNTSRTYSLRNRNIKLRPSSEFM